MIVLLVSWILVGFLIWLFLGLRDIRGTDYNSKDLKVALNIGDLLFWILCGWMSVIIILVACIVELFKSKSTWFKYFYEWIYSILYKIANVGVDKKENKRSTEEHNNKDDKSENTKIS